MSENSDRQTQVNFYLLLAGKFVSDIGTYLDLVVFPVYAYHLTQSGLYTGLFMACRFLGSFLSGFLSGVLADRFDRKRLMIFSDGVRSIALFVLAVGPTSVQLPVLYGCAFIVGAFNTLFDVALQSSIPVMVGVSHRVRANSLLGSSQSIAMVIGCLIGGILVSGSGTIGFWDGFRGAFIVDAATYVISAVNLLFLRINTSERGGAILNERFSFWEEVGGVWIYVKTIPIVFTMMLVRLLDCFGSAAHNIGIPLLSATMNPLRPTYFVGIIYAAWAFGKLISAFWMSRQAALFEGQKLEATFGVFTVLMSASFISLFLFHAPIVVVGIAIIAGFSDGVSDVCYSSRLQRTPDRIRGRVFGVSSTLMPIGFGLGTLIASPLFDLLQPGIIVAILHGLPILVTIGFSIYFALGRR